MLIVRISRDWPSYIQRCVSVVSAQDKRGHSVADGKSSHSPRLTPQIPIVGTIFVESDRALSLCIFRCCPAHVVSCREYNLFRRRRDQPVVCSDENQIGSPRSYRYQKPHNGSEGILHTCPIAAVVWRPSLDAARTQQINRQWRTVSFCRAAFICLIQNLRNHLKTHFVLGKKAGQQ
jgi:hypothetical protein